MQEFLPETFSIHNNNTDNDNGQVGFIIGDFYYYGNESKIQQDLQQKLMMKEKEMVLMQEKIHLLEKRISDLEEMNAILKNK